MQAVGLFKREADRRPWRLGCLGALGCWVAMGVGAPAWAQAERSEALPQTPVLSELGPGRSLAVHPSGLPGRSLLLRQVGASSSTLYWVEQGRFRALLEGWALRQVRWTQGGAEVHFLIRRQVGPPFEGSWLWMGVVDDAVRYRAGAAQLGFRRLQVERIEVDAD